MLIVRKMTKEDCARTAELEKKIFSQPWSEQGFRDALAGNQNIFLVAEDAGEICGYIGMYQSLDEGEITNVAVSADKRNTGIGYRLMQAALKEAKQQGISQVVLEVRVSNASAIHLYEKCGFVNYGVRKGFYEFPKEDAYIMIHRMQYKMIYCNKCGNPICMEESVEKADYIKIEKNWGYFSNKDGVCQKVNICEKCFDEIVEGFQIPPTVEENTELL